MVGKAAAKRDVKRTVLSNGARGLTERGPDAPTALIGRWVDAGSRFEELNKSGFGSIIQRLAAQPKEIGDRIDSLGGDVRFETG